MPSALPCCVTGLYGSIADLAESIVVPLGGGFDTEITLEDRGGAPNYGTGPYFKAKKRCTTWYTSSGNTLNIGRSRVGNDYRWYWSAIAYLGETSSYTTVGGMYYGPQYMYSVDHVRLVAYQDDNHDWFVRQESQHSGWIDIGREGEWIKPLTVEKARSLASWSGTWSTDWIDQCTSGGRIISNRVQYITGGDDVAFDFRNGEHATFCNITDLGIYINGSASRFAAAYTQAAQEAGDSSINSIANILEAIGAIKTIAEGLKEPTRALKELFQTYKDPRNAWLAYRYSYSTTKADVAEYKELVTRLKSLSQMLDKDIHSSGSYSDETGSYKVELRIPVKQVWPSDTYSWLSKVGIEPNAQNLWDMVPYSFVADWFLHVSDILEAFDNWTYSLTLWPSETWFTYMSEYDNQHVFYRVPGRKLDVPPHYENKSSSGKTWMMRFADSISLFS